MKRATTVAGVRREYKRASADPAKLQKLLRSWGRLALPDALEQWRGLLMATGADGVTRIALAGELIHEFRWDDLRQAMRPEHYDLVSLLYLLLQEQAAFASSVQDVLRGEAAEAKAQRAAGADAAKKQIDKWNPRQLALRAEASGRWEKARRRSLDAMSTRLASEKVAGYRDRGTIADLIRDLKPKK